MPFSSGHSAGGSALASALWTPTCTIFGVNRSVSTPATSIRAPSASPMRSSSQARSATQSAGWTSVGAGNCVSSALRTRICAQREAKGTSVRRIRADRNLPLARPQAPASNPVWDDGKGPTREGSRRANSGSSIGGGKSCSTSSARAASGDTISTAVSPPRAFDVAFCNGDGAGVGDGVGLGCSKPGGNRDSG